MTSKAAETGAVQVLHYLKRNPKFTRDQFWAYWKDIHGPKLVPLAERYGFTQYQQVRCGRVHHGMTRMVTLVVPFFGKDKFLRTHSSARLARLLPYLLRNLLPTWLTWSRRARQPGW